MSDLASALTIPDSLLAREATEILREHSTELLINHSIRVYLFAAEQGRQQKLPFDSELLYIAAAFHDLGLLKKFSSPNERFEVDGANAARQFLTTHNVPEDQVQAVWQAIALHTTPGITQHMRPEVALLYTGVVSMCSEEGSIAFLRICAMKSSPGTLASVSGKTLSRRTLPASHTSPAPPTAR
jgi:HD domain-containing protein